MNVAEWLAASARLHPKSLFMINCTQYLECFYAMAISDALQTAEAIRLSRDVAEEQL